MEQRKEENNTAVGCEKDAGRARAAGGKNVHRGGRGESERDKNEGEVTRKQRMNGGG